MSFQSIRQKFIDEAKMSPNMLSDIAGLERYISESYNNRSFIELLQNADDANATNFLVTREKEYLIVANNGRVFNEQDLISLCRSAASQKIRGESIGYRGIGFKSIVNIAQEVHIISGEYEITFSRKLTKEVVPDSKEVPLVRIPHPITNAIKQDTSAFITKWKGKGYTTFFVFSGIMTDKIEEDFRTIKNPSLLFLRNITLLENKLVNRKKIIKKIILNELSHKTIIRDGEQSSSWHVYSKNNYCIAFSFEQNGKIEKMRKDEALVYSFLPTEDQTGLGVLVNGDFSTDPSRRHLINDSITKDAILKICDLLRIILLDAIAMPEKADVIVASAPYIDCNLMKITGNLFEREFSASIRDFINLSGFVLCPTWLNLSDFLTIAKKLGINPINVSPTNTEAFAFMKYLGAKEFQLSDIQNEQVLNEMDFSIQGNAQLFTQIVRAAPIQLPMCRVDELFLVFSQGEKTSLKNINANMQSIDESYLSLLYDNGISISDLRHLFSKYQLINLNENLLSLTKDSQKKLLNNLDDIEGWYGDNNESGLSDVYPTQRWREVERLVMNVLNKNHFSLEDVSNQNLGYDLEGTDPYGKKVYIEIKSLDFSGQKFKMTNNEYACAQLKGASYILALAHLTQRKLDLMLVKDPVNSISFNRQCVQWVWECEKYSYKPHSFLLK